MSGVQPQVPVPFDDGQATPNATHTPGPWTVSWDEEDGWNNHIYSSPEDRVCFMAHGGPEKQPEFDANARLIAAAPDLLEALKLMRGTVMDHGDSLEWAVLRAAIAKAEGR